MSPEYSSEPMTYSQRAQISWRCPACGSLYSGPGVCEDSPRGPRNPSHPATLLPPPGKERPSLSPSGGVVSLRLFVGEDRPRLLDALLGRDDESDLNFDEEGGS